MLRRQSNDGTLPLGPGGKPTTTDVRIHGVRRPGRTDWIWDTRDALYVRGIMEDDCWIAHAFFRRLDTAAGCG